MDFMNAAHDGLSALIMLSIDNQNSGRIKALIAREGLIRRSVSVCADLAICCGYTSLATHMQG